MAYKKIIVSHVQSTKIHKILKADTGETPLQEFIDEIATEAEVEPWVAEKFASAWRWNHRNEDVSAQPEPAEKETGESLYYVTNDLPTKTTLRSSPENGTGKVAQIIALAEQGKSTAQIIELGFNKSTVYRQVSEWKKRKKTKTA